MNRLNYRYWAMDRIMKKRGTDQRRYGAANRFPLRDFSGCIIPFNRSHRPDRRLQNYSVCIVGEEDPELNGTDIRYGSS